MAPRHAAAHLLNMSIEHRVAAGVPSGGQFAAATREEADVNLNSAPQPPQFREIPENTRVAMTQGVLQKALSPFNGIAPLESQRAHRQINAEAHALLTLPDDQSIPEVGDLAPRAEAKVRNLLLHEMVPGRPGPMSTERAEAIAGYFTERARDVVRTHRADLDKGPNPANAYVNESLWIVARLRNPDANNFSLDAKRSALRNELLREAG